jgi:hypothetical protein
MHAKCTYHSTMDIRKDDLHASSVQLYEYTRDIGKTLEERGGDVGLDGVW